MNFTIDVNMNEQLLYLYFHFPCFFKHRLDSCVANVGDLLGLQ
jgi:hypothetical protein